jgi:predicted protein tyrosine phosphatase
MERVHRRRLQERFGSLLKRKKIAVLLIQDNYEFMDPELAQILQDKIGLYLRGKSFGEN